MLPEQQAARVRRALDLVAVTPGYQNVVADLRARMDRGRIHYDPALPDRARVGLMGHVVLGPEAINASPISLAQTLVHEWHHAHQSPLEKTASFWLGVATRQPVMRRFERPAYRAADRFLQAVTQAFPALAEEAHREQQAISAVFAIEYGEVLEG